MNPRRPMDEVEAEVVAFARARHWERFHDPKNLVMALMVEVGELGAPLRWTDNIDSDSTAKTAPARDALLDEIGDVGILLLLLCNRLDVRLEDVVMQKLGKNAARYPQAQSIGRAERPVQE